MLIISYTLCIISINYFNKEHDAWSLGAQLFLIFFNCVPRPFHGLIYSILEIIAHIYLQDVTRDFNMLDELPYKLFVLDILGIFFPSLLENSGIIARPYFATDYYKYNILYIFNLLYTFFIQGEVIRYFVISIQVFIILIRIINYFRKNQKLKCVHRKAKQIVSMAGSFVDDQYNYVIIEAEQILIVSFIPIKQVHRQMPIPSNHEYVGYAHPARAIILFDKQSFIFKSYDVTNFQLIRTIQSEANVSYIVHASKNYLAVFSQLNNNAEGTLITVKIFPYFHSILLFICINALRFQIEKNCIQKIAEIYFETIAGMFIEIIAGMFIEITLGILEVYDCMSGSEIVSVGLSHKINSQENMWIFDSFAVDLDKTSDKLIFSYERLLCSLDIDTKVNESLSTEFSVGFTLFKANHRRIVFSGKEDWVQMYDVPTNQPASLNNVFLSYSRIIPIQNLNDYYIVEPCCSKKNIYIMKGYYLDMKIITYFELGFPNISQAVYSKETFDLVFIDSKSNYVYRYPFQVNGRDNTASDVFEDSIVALD